MTEGTTAPFRLTADDVVAAARLYAQWGLTHPRSLAAFAVLWVAFVGFLNQSDVGFGAGPTRLVSQAGLACLPFVVMFGLSRVILPINARRNFKQQRSLQVELSMGWSAAGLHVESEYGAFDMPWSHFVRWRESAAVFVLFESDRLYRIVPKRVLSAAQQAEFTSLLSAVGR